jgi:hypothetical protein
MEPHLLEAFRYDDPGPRVRAATRAALRARARVLRHTPSNRRPTYSEDSPRVRGYPDGYELASLGTFAPFASGGGCPGSAASVS